MTSALGKLVSFSSENGYKLHGIYFSEEYNNHTIIHVHGNFGNFYQNEFISVMSKVYLSSGINLLSFNLTSHDGLAEGFKDGEFEYVGGAVSDFNECLNDIDAAICFAKKYVNHITLQGHSLGCDRIIYYLLKKGEKYNSILLSPVDSNKVQEHWIGYKVADQIKGLRMDKENLNKKINWLPMDSYGAKGNNKEWIYQIPICKSALTSILEGAAFKYLNLDLKPIFKIDAKCIVYCGVNDGLLTCTPSDMISYLREKFTEIEEISYLKADHDLVGVEEIIAVEIVRTVKNWSNIV